MNKLELLDKYLQHHVPEIMESIFGNICFCSDANCSKCKVNLDCDKIREGAKRPTVTESELVFMKHKYPERFI